MNKIKEVGNFSASDYFDAMTLNCPGAVILIDANGKIINVNPAGCKILSVSTEEALNGNLFEIVPEKVSQALRQYSQDFRDGRKKPVMIEFPTSQGKILNLSIEMYSCAGDCFEADCQVIFMSNVTALKRTEEALQRTLTERMKLSSLMVANSDIRYQSLIEASPNWVSLLDEEGRILVMNQSGQRILERPPEETDNQPVWSFFSGDEARRLRLGIQGAINTGNIYQEELELNVREKIKHLSLVCNSIRPVTSAANRAVIIVTDITARKNAEIELKKTLDTLEQRVQERTRQLETANHDLAKEIFARKEFEKQLKKSKEEAESANLAKSEFLANMSHEIRTPMNSVLGFISLLLGTNLDAKQRDYAQTVKTSGTLLLALIDDILDLSKIEANRLVLEKIPFSFGEMIQEIVKLFEPKAHEKEIRLTLEIDEFLIGNCVLGDYQRIRQVLINLIGNAVKFTREGYVVVKAFCHRNDDGMFFIDATVEDSGIGISKNDLPKIFGKFTQANSSTTRKYGGTGLGLAISKRLIDLMGGTLGCCSTLGKGSEFFFHIPFEIPAEKKEQVALPKDSENEATPQKAQKQARILLVEDDESCRKFAGECILDMGFELESIDNGIVATEILLRQPFDLVVMDWCLPGWNGLMIVEQLRKSQGPNQRIPVLAVTARAMKGDREACIKAGMNDYLAKPFSPVDLKRKIEKLLCRPCK
jgi:PAS domain S-box-containing protein